MRRCIIIALALAVPWLALADDESDWDIHKTRHFLVHHRKDKTFAKSVGKEAEKEYQRIVSDLGFSKRDNFWLWDDRAKIYVYPSHDSFVKEENAPGWAGGKSNYKEKTISTYAHSESFVDRVLSHELAHLVFRDFVGFKGDVPLWLDEGVAQWEENGGQKKSILKLGEMNATNRIMSLSKLTAIDVDVLKKEKDPAEFYAQSASVVGFMIDKYGAASFTKFCRELRDGKELKDALRFTYPTTIRTIKKLEEAWLKHLKESLVKGKDKQ